MVRSATSPPAWEETAPKLKLNAEAWVLSAACADHPRPGIFFPERGRDKNHEAKAICAACPVRIDCLQYALRENISFGVWGGLSEAERHLMPKRTERLLTDVVRICPGCNLVRVFFEKGKKKCDPCNGVSFRARKKLGVASLPT